MAICRIVDTGATPEQYDQVRAQVSAGDSPPPGSQLHLAARGEDGNIRVIDVWDTREQAEAFTEKVRAAREELGIGRSSPPQITYLEVHRLTTA
jgi:hypothetical protein